MMANATAVAKSKCWIGGVAYILALFVELTGGAARLPAVGAKNWLFGTLVAVELVLPPRFMLSPRRKTGVESVELKAYDVVVKVRGR